MANDFTDPRCKALWRFESGALTTDSKGTNTLTNNNVVTVDNTNFWEGAGSALFTNASQNRLSIADALLDTGFPLKYGDSVKKATFCFWLQPTVLGNNYCVFAKSWNSGSPANNFALLINGPFLTPYIGWYNGVSVEFFNFPSSLIANHVYHIAVLVDGVNKVLKVRIWDATVSTVNNYLFYPSGTLALSTGELSIGGDPTAGEQIDGNIDEFVVFNDLLTDAEIDDIRNGTYVAGPEFAYTGQVPLVLTPQSTYEGPGAPFVYAGQVALTLTPQATYEGPAGPAVYAIVGSGGVKISGVGVVAYKVPGVLAVVGAGGVTVAGEGVITFFNPLILEVVGDGGIVVSGRGVFATRGPLIDAHIGSGGLKIGGQGIFGGVTPFAASVLSVVGTGGLVINGQGVVNITTPPVLAIIGSGGIVIGNFRVPELTVVQFIYPADLTLMTVVGSGGIEVDGTGVITLTYPPIYAVPPPQSVADANIRIGGAGVIAFISPQILQVIADGGITIGGTPLGDDLFATYALTGIRGEPSLYSNFPFNSYAKHRGQYFGAGDDGIYLLEGADDAGEEIHPGVRIGPVNFGTDREKRLRLLRCGGKTRGAKVRVSNGNGSAGYYDVENGRAGVSRDVQGRELLIEITDFESLDHLEIIPTILHKR